MNRLGDGKRGGLEFDPVVSSHTRAVLEALIVTILWSSSYVLITIGLDEIPALTFAGLRYSIATLVLFPMLVHQGGHRALPRLTRGEFTLLIGLGITLYAITQGAQFVALQYLRATSVSLILTFTPIIVLLVSVPVLGERSTRRQWLWLGLLFVGVACYFYPFDLGPIVIIGIAIMVVGLCANAAGAILGREINRRRGLSAITVTIGSMAVGSSLLLGSGILIQGVPPLGWQSWLIVLWLAVINTAFAFTLWNRTLQSLSAAESSVINNTMLAQIAIMGWVFLGESLSASDILGVAVVMAGAILFQRTGK